MVRSPVIMPIVCGLIFICGTASAAGPANFAGEYADKNFLNGNGVFQMSLEQNGNSLSIFFSAAHNDGRGAAPEADATGKITSKGIVEFKWEDSFKNAGTGTISRAGNDVIVSLKPTRVVDPRCLEFYRQNIHLKPAGKK
jgi:hypothetical protein